MTLTMNFSKMEELTKNTLVIIKDTLRINIVIHIIFIIIQYNKMIFKLHISNKLSKTMRQFLIRMIFLNEIKRQRTRRLRVDRQK
jgi:hypothetical protein